MNHPSSPVIAIACWATACGLLAASAGAGQATTTLDFTNLPFPHGTILTTEFAADGIVFSDDDTGIDPGFPCLALVGMENRVLDGQLFNLFRIEFVTADPVVEVMATFRDQNTNDQLHQLFELDSNLQIVASDFFDDTGTSGAVFTLELTDPGGIAGIAACEQPVGAEAFLSITFVTQSGLIFADGFESGDTSAWTLAVP